MIMVGDNPNVLDVIKMYGNEKLDQWQIKDFSKSQLYKDFPLHLANSMGSKKYARHYHTYAIAYKTFMKHKKLSK